jgi:hypothetical protein
VLRASGKIEGAVHQETLTVELPLRTPLGVETVTVVVWLQVKLG